MNLLQDNFKCGNSYLCTRRQSGHLACCAGHWPQVKLAWFVFITRRNGKYIFIVQVVGDSFDLIWFDLFIIQVHENDKIIYKSWEKNSKNKINKRQRGPWRIPMERTIQRQWRHPGAHLYFRLDIIRVKGLSKHTLNTYADDIQLQIQVPPPPVAAPESFSGGHPGGKMR